MHGGGVDEAVVGGNVRGDDACGRRRDEDNETGLQVIDKLQEGVLEQGEIGWLLVIISFGHQASGT